MKENLLCTSCPLGCQLEVEFSENKIISVKGNNCKKGIEYAEKEIFHPERIVTTTVKISGAALFLLPVKTETSVPRELCFKVIESASKLQVRAPVKMGEVLIRDILKSGVNLVATRSLEKVG